MYTINTHARSLTHTGPHVFVDCRLYDFEASVRVLGVLGLVLVE